MAADVSTVTWRAPGRVNLVGEHTDYNDGFVLPFAIDRSVRVTATARGDGLLELRSRHAAAVTVSLDSLEPGQGWADYPAGVAWALMAAGYPVTGASLAVDSDLPQGAGLASSAALECAVAACLADLAGLALRRSEIAAIAWRAENEFVGMPCGIMDQSAVMLCEAGHALLLDCGSGESVPVPLAPGGLKLLVIDTGVRHELTGGEYAVRRRECEEAARLLCVPSLRFVPDEAALDSLTGPIARRARHVLSENGRVGAVVNLLRAGRLADCGPLLTQSHRSLRDDFEVSWPEADLSVDVAVAAGALGARMTGGGFGGCVIALVPAHRAASVTDSVRAAFAETGRSAPKFMEVVPAPGAGRI
ncbi:MAG TPA: galactokinase [Streptosporangiaceae bacterium]|nr:galactokinase [Streptosporangiaceae bacterium]